MDKNALQWDKLLKIKTTGRDDSNSDQYQYPYEPTLYPVLERPGYWICPGGWFVFSDGEILELKDGEIVKRKLLMEFAEKPAQTYGQMQDAVSLVRMLSIFWCGY